MKRDKPFYELIELYYKEHPDATLKEVAGEVGCSVSYCYLIRRRLAREGIVSPTGGGGFCVPLIRPQTHIDWLEKQLRDTRAALQAADAELAQVRATAQTGATHDRRRGGTGFLEASRDEENTRRFG